MTRNNFISIAVWVLLATQLLWFFSTTQGAIGVIRTRQIGVSVLAARESVGGLDSEYPPLATFIFYFLQAHSFSLPYATAWTVALALLFAAASLYAGYRLGERDRWSLTVAFILTLALLGADVTFGRYDFMVVVPLFLTWRTFVCKRYFDSGLFLTLASFLKIFPLVIIPALYLATPRGQRLRLLGGMVVGLMVAWLLPLTVMGLDLTYENILFVSEYHTNRGVQVESSWSGLQMLWDAFNGEKSITAFHHGAHHNESVGGWVTTVPRLIFLTGISFVYALAWVRREKTQSTALILYMLLLVVWTMLMSTILSPQFFVWLLPLVIAWVIERVVHVPIVNTRVVAIAAITVIMGLLTQWIYPSHYDQLLQQDSFVLIVLFNVRNTCLVLLLFLFGLELKKTLDLSKQ